MTNRLYYTDPYCGEFDASVESFERRGARAVIVLDRSAFYPTSGGQPFDTGTLGGLAVVDVTDQDDGSVAHLVELGPDESSRSESRGPVAGATIHGVVNWARRFDHMQQHTGQHVLSAAFDHLFHIRTVSFHLGAVASTIDLARDVSEREIREAENEANRIVWEDHPVTIQFADAEEAAALPLRKESKRGGTLRLIDIDGFDLSACGGTHVARTGAIGIIAVASWERFKGGQRLEFLCGGRALERFRALRDAAAAGTRLLSVAPEELPGAIERMQADAKDQKRAMNALVTELARYRAEELAGSAEATDRGRLVLRVLDEDANGLKSLAMAIAARPGYATVLVSTSTPPLVVVARAADVAVPANTVLAALTARFGGRGGGKPELAQGGGLNAPADAILDAARAAILGH
jgi:alanyl-tRNA synthetase